MLLEHADPTVAPVAQPPVAGHVDPVAERR